jgi:hypothetical protein
VPAAKGSTSSEFRAPTAPTPTARSTDRSDVRSAIARRAHSASRGDRSPRPPSARAARRTQRRFRSAISSDPSRPTASDSRARRGRAADTGAFAPHSTRTGARRSGPPSGRWAASIKAEKPAHPTSSPEQTHPSAQTPTPTRSESTGGEICVALTARPGALGLARWHAWPPGNHRSSQVGEKSDTHAGPGPLDQAPAPGSVSESSIMLPHGSRKNARRRLMSSISNGSPMMSTPRRISSARAASTLSTWRQTCW